jgi:heat shock protein HtpX
MFSNNFKTGLLIFGLIWLCTEVGNALGDASRAQMGFCIAAVMSLYSYWFSDKMVIKAYKCREVSKHDNPRLYNIVAELAERAGLPMPRVYIVPEEQPNAFATGRNPKHAAVACTEGLLKMMNDNELRGVLGHELGHVKHRDILISTIAAVFAGAITNMSKMFGVRTRGDNRRISKMSLLVTVLAPIAALIIQMTISRRREYMADATGAELSGNPEYLMSALEKLEQTSKSIPFKNTSRPATENMFIVNPFSGLKGIENLFRTHPRTEDRIKALSKLRIGK